MKILNSIYLIVIIGFFISFNTFAHVRWFVEEETETAIYEWKFVYFLLIGLALLYAIISFYIDKKLVPFYQGAFFRLWNKFSQWDLLSYACGITFIFISFENIFIAPNIKVSSGLQTYLIVQAVCGIVLLSVLPRFFSGLAVFLLCFLTIKTVDVSIWIDYVFEFFVIALAFSTLKWFPSFSLTVLRIGLGLQLMVLAIHNKLMDPSLGLNFLDSYQWNFMKGLGLSSFDDLLFVFSAGIAELTFGLLIALGVGTRFVVLTVSCFFLITSLVLGLHELVGHIPIIACCLVLFTLGSGLSLKDVINHLNEQVIPNLSRLKQA